MIAVIRFTILAICGLGQDILLDENVPCDNFGGKFGNIKDLEVSCRKHSWKKKWWCKLKCTNGFENLWARGRRSIKCKTKNHPDEWRYDPEKPTIYKWQPSAMRNADSICDPSVTHVCDNIRQEYNVSDKHLKWEKTPDWWWQSRLVKYVFR